MPKTFVDYGQVGVTLLVVLTLSISSVLFYKMMGALIAHLLSQDISSFFIMARGVYSVHSPHQNPFLIQHLISGLLLAPALQFLSIFLLYKGVKIFMYKANNYMKDKVYSEIDVLKFGFLATVIFVFLETLLYAQNISIISGAVNLVYLALAKLGCICFFLTTGHIHLLSSKKYKESLTTYLLLEGNKGNRIYNQKWLVFGTYAVSVVLNAPFYSGIQFMQNNAMLLLLFVSIAFGFYFFLKRWLYKRYDYLGFVMLSSEPKEIFNAGWSISGNTFKKIFKALILCLLLLLIIKLKFFFLATSLALLALFVFLVAFSSVYLMGYIVGKMRATHFGHSSPSFFLKNFQGYSFAMTKAIGRSLLPLLLGAILVFEFFTFFPKAIHYENGNFVNAVMDQNGYPLSVGYSDGNSCIPISQKALPEFLVKCLIAQEDRSFFFTK